MKRSDVHRTIQRTYSLDFMGRLHRQDGKMASQHERKFWETKVDFEVRIEGPTIKDKRTEKERGKFLTKRYVYYFFCVCEVDFKAKTPKTKVGKGQYIVEHNYGYSSGKSDRTKKASQDIIDGAIRAHNRHYKDHRLQEITWTLRKEQRF